MTFAFCFCYRGMAISLLIMCGRIGTAVAVNLMSLILFDYCNVMMGIIFGILLKITIAIYFILRKTAGAVTITTKV